MRTKKASLVIRAAEALGATRVVDLKTGSQGGPLDWLAIAKLVKDRLISRGGRPSDPQWEIKRLVPFRTRTWETLTNEAKTMSSFGRKVGPAQLAAIIVENCISPAQTETQTAYAYGVAQSIESNQFVRLNIVQPVENEVDVIPHTFIANSPFAVYSGAR